MSARAWGCEDCPDKTACAVRGCERLQARRGRRQTADHGKAVHDVNNLLTETRLRRPAFSVITMSARERPDFDWWP